jgi:hypothetical protein
MTEKELLVELAKAWNHQNASYIENLMDDGFKYTSQWVFEEMVGKEKYLEYIGAKFQKIREGIAQNGDTVEAEIGFCTQMEPAKPCIVLSQTSNGATHKVTILITALNGLIKSIGVCGIPEPESARLTGEVPK